MFQARLELALRGLALADVLNGADCRHSNARRVERQFGALAHPPDFVADDNSVHDIEWPVLPDGRPPGPVHILTVIGVHTLKEYVVRKCGPSGHIEAVSYTHLRAHETGRNLVCR